MKHLHTSRRLKHLHFSHRLGTTSTLLVVLKLLHTPPRVSPTGLSGPFRHLSLLRCSPLFLRVSGNLGSTLPSSFLASRTTMVFSLNCSLARFYRGIIQSSSDLLYPHVYCRPRSSRCLSCTSPRITGSSSISRWRVTRVPISSLVSPPPHHRLVFVFSKGPRCVLTVSSGGLQGTITCYRNITKLQSFIVHSSSNHVLNAIPVSSLYPHRIIDVSRIGHHRAARTSSERHHRAARITSERHHCTATASSQHRPDH